MTVGHSRQNIFIKMFLPNHVKSFHLIYIRFYQHRVKCKALNPLPTSHPHTSIWLLCSLQYLEYCSVIFLSDKPPRTTLGGEHPAPQLFSPLSDMHTCHGLLWLSDFLLASWEILLPTNLSGGRKKRMVCFSCVNLWLTSSARTMARPPLLNNYILWKTRFEIECRNLISNLYTAAIYLKAESTGWNSSQ